MNPPVNTLYPSFLSARSGKRKKLAVLIDPDKMRLGKMQKLIELAIRAQADYFFIGGSLVVSNQLEECIEDIRRQSEIPVILFPGDAFQLSNRADGILFLSLISGRNPELLIGKHVITAPYLKESRLEVIPTGYMLIDGGVPTTVAYISNTTPIPSGKNDVAVCTAMAGEMLGLRTLYLDAGSGANHTVPPSMVKAVRNAVNVPIIVGGGIRSPEQASALVAAGADILVVGSAFEDDPSLVISIANAVFDSSISIDQD